MVCEHNDADRRLGKNLKQARQSAGLSQAALANEIGVAPQTIAKFECGAVRLSAVLLAACAGAIGAPISRFFHGVVEKPLQPVDKSGDDVVENSGENAAALLLHFAMLTPDQQAAIRLVATAPDHIVGPIRMLLENTSAPEDEVLSGQGGRAGRV